MPKTSVIAHLVAKPDQLEEVQAELERLVASTADEAGTEQYVLTQDAADGTSFWFFELYTDDAALGVHGGSDAMAAALVALDGKLAEAPVLHVTRPVKAKGIEV